MLPPITDIPISQSQLNSPRITAAKLSKTPKVMAPLMISERSMIHLNAIGLSTVFLLTNEKIHVATRCHFEALKPNDFLLENTRNDS